MITCGCREALRIIHPLLLLQALGIINSVRLLVIRSNNVNGKSQIVIFVVCVKWPLNVP